VNLVALVWGFAESTLFFVVPDVWITDVATGDTRAALKAGLATLGGALLGGLVMFAVGAHDLDHARALLDHVPGVGPAMIDRVGDEVGRHGAVALFLGPLRGTPYKIYAVQAGGLSVALPVFLLVSVPARLLRFWALAGVAGWISRRPLVSWPRRRKRRLALIGWAAFYALYFGLLIG
jgi:membrane protein YqaA with SNARE-associated domain